MLLVAEGLEKGTWTLDKLVTISQGIQKIGGSQAHLHSGDTWTLGQLMSAIAVCSANDAAVAVAEGLWGSKEAYLQVSNRRAQELGMKDSVFHSVNGLPPGPGEEVDQTTARDMAILARQCIRHPSIMQWVGQKEVVLRPGDPIKMNTNKLLWQMPGCDGLKTGFTNAAGWCLTATAERDGVRLIGVIMGCESKRDRFSYSQEILEQGFTNITRQHVVVKGQRLNPPVQVANCATGTIQVAAGDDAWAIVPTSAVPHLQVVTQCPTVLQAPVAAGTIIGKAQVVLDGRVLATVPVTVPEKLEPATWKWKLEQSVKQTGDWLRNGKPSS